MAVDFAKKAGLYQGVIENMNTAVVLMDQDLRLDYLNPAAEMLFDISLKQSRGTGARELFAGSRELIGALLRCLSQDMSFTEREIHLTVPATQKNLLVDCTLVPLLGGDGRRQVLAEMQQKDHLLKISREEQLLSQQTAMRALLRGLAHEVKNPLGGLRGAAQLLERELRNAGLREYTQIIIGEADRLQKLVDDMLGPNRLPRKQLGNIHEVLEHVRTLVLAEAPPTLHIARDYDPSIPESPFDRNQLVQATLNIVRNAYEALEGKGQITLRTRTRRQVTIGHDVHRLAATLEIIDNGPGIAPEMIDQVFYPMVTGRAEGTGLGLSIAQSIVNQHGGLVQCHSAPGRTVFTLLLPIQSDGTDRNRGATHVR